MARVESNPSIGLYFGRCGQGVSLLLLDFFSFFFKRRDRGVERKKKKKVDVVVMPQYSFRTTFDWPRDGARLISDQIRP